MGKIKNLNRFGYWNDWAVADFEVLGNCYALNEVGGAELLSSLSNTFFSLEYELDKESLKQHDFTSYVNIFRFIYERSGEKESLEKFTAGRATEILRDLEKRKIPKLPNFHHTYFCFLTNCES